MVGRLIDGEWDPEPARGHDYDEGFHDWISSRTASDTTYPAEAGRYHLYIARSCPWAHRAALVRALKGLEGAISVDVVDPVRKTDGWEFAPEKDGCTPDSVTGASYLREVYTTVDPSYTGRPTVPVLYDTETDRIVNTESADIARILASEFDEYADREIPLYPEDQRDEIDEVADRVHDGVNRQVYRAGFADTQDEYETAVDELFEALGYWNDVLGERRYLLGEKLTLADVFLFPTLFRFDAVYHTHFKCNVKRLVEFEHLWAYARDVYQIPGVESTCNLDHVKEHYYLSHEDLNPTGFVPPGPAQDWSKPHNRDRFSESESSIVGQP